jgi:broad specificity phosphatase PhoE
MNQTNNLILLLTAALILAGCQTTSESTTPEAPTDPTTLFLVRHAEKASDGTTDPPLTEEGHARARALRDMLYVAGIDAIYSTEFKRTRLTAQPLADTLGIEIQSYPPFDSAWTSALPERHAGEQILIVGHSNTTPALVNHLAGSNYKQLGEMEYDKVFVVSGDNRRMVATQLVLN